MTKVMILRWKMWRCDIWRRIFDCGTSASLCCTTGEPQFHPETAIQGQDDRSTHDYKQEMGAVAISSTLKATKNTNKEPLRSESKSQGPNSVYGFVLGVQRVFIDILRRQLAAACVSH